MIRVLLADDELLVRAGIRAVLAADPGIEVVAEADYGRATVDLALAHRPDVVLLDIGRFADSVGAGSILDKAFDRADEPSPLVVVALPGGDQLSSVGG